MSTENSSLPSSGTMPAVPTGGGHLVEKDLDELSPPPPEFWPVVDHLVTEDDTPVDNFPSEKQQRLLTEPLYSSWTGPGEGKTFLAAANVALFHAVGKPPMVPDVFLSLEVQVADDWWNKRHRSYFFWEFEKPPEAVVEVVSNKEGEELGAKKIWYAQRGILYYAVWDPNAHLSNQPLRLFVLRDKSYVSLESGWLPVVGLGLVVWKGAFESKESIWLRWCDQQGNVIPTGAERAEQERQRAEQERQRAEQERQRAEQERQRAQQEQAEKENALRRAQVLEAQLRALGVEPQA